MYGYDEKSVLQMLAKPIETHTLDYKCFISERKSENLAQYRAVIAIIVPIDKGEAVLKEIMRFTPEIEFRGSEVQLGDERGVDILSFEVVLDFTELIDKKEAEYGL